MLNPLQGLNDPQKQVVQAVHGPVLVLAGAGSGKTKALTHRIAYLLTERLAHPSQILAVTFTNKAAQEMRLRLSSLLKNTAQVPKAISTFHGLGVKILREQTGFHPR